ncbi:MAG: hypothetical protein ABW252_03525 [Polyangiales bacterium]
MLGVTIATSVFALAGIGWSLLRLLSRRIPLEESESLLRSGEIAVVVSPIGPGLTGEICFTRQELVRFAAARSDRDLVLPKGTEVVVTHIERGLAFVRRLDLP